MTDKKPSKSDRPPEKTTSSGERDPAVTVAIITGIATVVAAIITAIVGPILTRETPQLTEPQTSPSPLTSSEKAFDTTAQLLTPMREKRRFHATQ